MKFRAVGIAAVLVLAFALRILFLVLAGLNAPLTGDELAYQQIAEHFAAGLGLFQTNNPFFPGQVLYAWQAPFYPLSLGILYSVVGSNLLLAKLFGVLVSTATVYIVYDLAHGIFRSAFASTAQDKTQTERISLVAAFLIAVYPGLLTQAHLLLSETLFIFLLLLAFDLVARGFESRRRLWLWLAGAGAVWGLATLTRGITLYFTPLLALWVGWMIWQDEGRESGKQVAQSDYRKSPLRAVIGAGLFAVAALVVIAPWAARNYGQFHQFVLVETKGGVNLWLGNSPNTPNEFIRNVWKVGVREPMLDALAPNNGAVAPDEVQRDRVAYVLALNFIRSEPLTFLARMPSKFADFWGFERSLIDNAEATTRGDGWNSPAKVAADLFSIVVYMFVMLVGVAGFVFAPPNSWKVLLGGFTIYFILLHLVIFGDGRFHLPLTPFFAFYAAWFLVMRKQIIWTASQTALAALCALLLLGVWVREAVVALGVLRAG